MTNKPKAIGTAAETAVARYLAANGFPHAERRALRGTLDAGDITGTPGVCWEVKGGAAAQNAGDGQVTSWLVDTNIERLNAGADVGVLVLQRRGFSAARVGRWWAVMPLGDVLALRDPTTPAALRLQWPVRVMLTDAVALLRAAGYGAPLEVTP